MDGLYRDKKGELWVVIHLDTGDELEWGEDLSDKLNLPQYTVISSGNSDFLDMKHSESLEKINDVEYKCICFGYQSADYIYVDEDKFLNFIKGEFEKICNDYNNLLKFIKKYGDLICAVGDKDD